MESRPFVLITDRGGHLHNALKLVEQMGSLPHAIITTQGPDVDALKQYPTPVYAVPHLFKWFGKLRVLNPIAAFSHCFASFRLVLKLRPEKVISLGASNVVFFCVFARIFGAQIYHVECMNQVHSPSITGRLLYPFCTDLYVQWEELLAVYGPKARYEGWVL